MPMDNLPNFRLCTKSHFLTSVAFCALSFSCIIFCCCWFLWFILSFFIHFFCCFPTGYFFLSFVTKDKEKKTSSIDRGMSLFSARWMQVIICCLLWSWRLRQNVSLFKDRHHHWLPGAIIVVWQVTDSRFEHGAKWKQNSIIQSFAISKFCHEWKRELSTPTATVECAEKKKNCKHRNNLSEKVCSTWKGNFKLRYCSWIYFCEFFLCLKVINFSPIKNRDMTSGQWKQ